MKDVKFAIEGISMKWSATWATEPKNLVEAMQSFVPDARAHLAKFYDFDSSEVTNAVIVKGIAASGTHPASEITSAANSLGLSDGEVGYTSRARLLCIATFSGYLVAAFALAYVMAELIGANGAKFGAYAGGPLVLLGIRQARQKLREGIGII